MSLVAPELQRDAKVRAGELKAQAREARIEELTAAPETTLSVPAPTFLAGSEGDDIVQWTIDQLLTAEAIGFIAAEPKTLKTWVSIELALAVAADVRAFGRFGAGILGPVLMVQEESRSADFARRVRWLARGHDLDPSALSMLHVASQRGLLLDDPGWQLRLVSEIRRLDAAMVVLDPLSRMHSADEDRAREMRPILRFLRRLQAEHGCTVVVVHHWSKPREGVRTRLGQRLRGTGDMYAVLDSALYLEAKPGAGVVGVQVEHREAPWTDPFTLRLEQDPETGSARLLAETGTLADLAALEALPDIESVLDAHPEGLRGSEVEDLVPRRAQVTREGLKRLETLGRAISTLEQRQDAAGRARQVRVWKRRSA